MTYETTIDTPNGLRRITCTDAQIDQLGPLSLTRLLRDECAQGVYVAASEIACAFHREVEEAE